MSFTPGPWRAAFAASIDGPAPFAESLVVATEASNSGGIHDTICVVTPKDTLREVDTANAGLIAAAPDLIVALRGLMEFVEEMARHKGEPMIVDSRIGAARKAIAKAAA